MNVYQLRDPRTLGIKYIGITNKTIEHRLQMHIKDSKVRARKAGFLSAKDRWILELLQCGLKPLVECIHANIDEKLAEIEEQRLIAKYRKIEDGGQLLNIQDGGYYTSQLTVPWNKGKTNCISDVDLIKMKSHQPNRKTIYVFDKKKNRVGVFLSIRTMCEELKLDRRAVTRCINGDENFKSHKGYMFNTIPEAPIYHNNSTDNIGPRQHTKPITCVRNGVYTSYPSIKEAVLQTEICLSMMKKLLKQPDKQYKGYSAYYCN